MWFSFTETYWWSACTSCWFVIYLCWHIFCVENILRFQYCFWLFTDVDYFSCAKCSYHSRLMFMWFSVTETYWWSACTSCWFVIYLCWHIFCVENILRISILVLIIYWCWLFFMCKMFLSFPTDVYVIFCYWNILMKCTHFMLICHLLMLTYFLCRKYSRISILLLIIYWCWLFFMCKIFLSFSTDVYVIFCYWNILMKCMHFMLICHLLMLTYFLCRKYSTISILLLIIYWCWLFFMCKMFLSFSTDVYVIFCYWNILMKCMHFMLICHLLMLTYFLCREYSRISILLLIIYWCWLFFMCQSFFKKVSLSSGHKVSLRKFL